MNTGNEKMKIVHCCTYVEAHSAHIRLHKALQKEGIESRVLSLKEGGGAAEEVYNIKEFGKRYAIYQSRAYYYNIFRFLFLSKICGLQENMPYNLGGIGIDISEIEMLKEADIIHLHWINDCFLSLQALKKIVSLNKPIVITLHDSWFLTGGCHVLNGCTQFEDECRNCPQLKRGKRFALNALRKKKEIMRKANIILVAPGRWTKKNVFKSGIFRESPCRVIGNTLDFSIFTISEEIKAKRKIEGSQTIRILFGAINSTSTPYKGFSYLREMLALLRKRKPDLAKQIELNIFGADNNYDEEIQLYQHRFWGYIKEEKALADLYNQCDIYLVPSLEDSFNQTVLESCACGTPVVSFQTGGICDIIRHKETGYLAKYKDSKELLEGVIWILENNLDNAIGRAASEEVRNRFSQKKVAEKYIEVYKTLV